MVNIAQREIAAYNAAMPRELVWVDQPRFRGWGCSECAWVFNPSDPPTGEDFNAMVRNFESQRDKEFASHLCSKHPRQSKPTRARNFTGRNG
jgi:rubredoxin